jgi:hypothetical protein
MHCSVPIQGQEVKEDTPLRIEYSHFIPVTRGRGEAPNNIFKIYYNEVDRVAPIHMNTNTKQLARLNIHLDQIQMTSDKQSLAADGYWYYVMSGFIEATFGSALVTYKLSLNGKLKLIFNMSLC